MATVSYEPSDRTRWDLLKQNTGILSDRELLDAALSLLHWAVEQVTQSRQIGSFDPARKNYRLVHMPVLRQARKNIAA